VYDQWEYDSTSSTFLSKFSELVVDLNGTVVVQRPFTDTPTQKWRFNASESYLRSSSSQDANAGVAGNAKPGAVITVSSKNSLALQQWLLIDINAPTPRPVPVHSGGGFFGSSQRRGPPRPRPPQPPTDYDDAPSNRAYAPSQGRPEAPKPLIDYIGGQAHTVSQPFF
jgi:hypothetical protein